MVDTLYKNPFFNGLNLKTASGFQPTANSAVQSQAQHQAEQPQGETFGQPAQQPTGTGTGTGTGWTQWTAGRDGSTYAQALAKGFDPWTYGWSNTNRGDLDTVFRWTNDIAAKLGYTDGNGHGRGDFMPAADRAKIFAANIERLRQQYADNGLNWNNSYFASFDNGGQNWNYAGGYGLTHPGQVAQQSGVASPGGVPTTTPGQAPTTVTTPTSATPGTASTTTPGAGGTGQYTPIQQALLADDPNLALQIGLRDQGYNINQPGLLNSFIKNRFSDLLGARIAAAGVGGAGQYLDQMDQIVKQFSQGLLGRGGNFYGDLRTIGQQALANGGDYLNNLSDQQQAQQYIQQLEGLINGGDNPMVQQALSDVFKRDASDYNLYSFDNEGAGRNIDPFQKWWATRPYARYFTP